MAEGLDVKLRENARRYAFLALYAKMLGDDGQIIAAEFVDKFDKEFAISLIDGVTEYSNEIMKLIEKSSKDFSLAQIFACDLVILKMAVCEVNYVKTPKEVVINEFVNLAKVYSTKKSGKFINGVLATIFN